MLFGRPVIGCAVRRVLNASFAGIALDVVFWRSCRRLWRRCFAPLPGRESLFLAKKRNQKKATPVTVPATRGGRLGRGFRPDVRVRAKTVGIHASPRCAGLVGPAGLTAQRGPGIKSRLIAVCFMVASVRGLASTDSPTRWAPTTRPAQTCGSSPCERVRWGRTYMIAGFEVRDCESPFEPSQERR